MFADTNTHIGERPHGPGRAHAPFERSWVSGNRGDRAPVAHKLGDQS